MEPCRRKLLQGIASTTAMAGIAISTRSLGISRASAAVPEKITIGYLPLNALLSPYAGGNDPWKEQGLEVSFFRAGAGPAVVQAMVTKQIPVGEVGIGPAISVASRGFPLYFLTGGAMEAKPKYVNSRIMSKKGSPIKKFTDLKGKKLAVHALGTMQHICLGAAFKTFGMKREDITITTIPIPNQPQALDEGLVDAIYCAPPADTVAEQRYGAQTVLETVDFIPYLQLATIAVNQEFADSNPDAIKRLVKGAVLLQRWVDDNENAAREASNQSLGIAAADSSFVRLPYFPRDALPLMPNVWHVYHMMLDAKVIEPIGDLGAITKKYFIEPVQKFTQPALAELGPQQDPTVDSLRNQQLPLLPKPNKEYAGPWES